MRRIIYSAAVFGLAFILSSCAPVKPFLYPTQEISLPSAGPVLRQDVFHAAAPGETLWRISKMYNVTIEDIMLANNLKKSTKLAMGQRLLIPLAEPVRPVISLYPSRKWKYIIIHHSATDEGNALFFDKSHRCRGWKGIGYHFVIDNGTRGKEDGQIEVSPRWIKQKNGAHCKASGMNYKSIGICLVGNFSRERVSEKQMHSLVLLTNVLRKYYGIHLRNILGHGRVKGAKTECPGRFFPWDEFTSELKRQKR